MQSTNFTHKSLFTVVKAPKSSYITQPSDVYTGSTSKNSSPHRYSSHN